MRGGSADRNPPAEEVPVRRTQDIIPVERPMSGRDATSLTLAVRGGAWTESGHGTVPWAPWIAPGDVFVPRRVVMHRARRSVAEIASGESWGHARGRKCAVARATRARRVLSGVEASIRAHAATTQARRWDRS